MRLLVRRTDDLVVMVQRLENVEGVAGLEIGLPQGTGAETIRALGSVMAEILPWILQLSFEQASDLAPVAIESGAMAVSLSQ